MNIHFLVTKDFFKGGGIETYTREVARRLVVRGHRVTVYSTRGGDHCPPEWEGTRLIWLRRVKPHWAEKCFGAGAAAYRVLREERPDVIHLHSVVAGSLAPLLRWTGAPAVVQMHGVEWMRSRWGAPARTVLKTMERLSLLSADAITAVSNTQCEYFRTHYGAHCEYIPTAADIKHHVDAHLIHELGLRERQFILFAARLVAEKGAHHLVEAFRRTSTPFQLVIAGDAPAGRYRQQLAALAKDDPRIRFLGRVQGRLLEELYSNAALFVQPSEIEGLSIGLIEAMSYRLPCLASDIPENKEVVGDVSFLFRNKNVNDLECQLTAALANPEKALELGALGHDRVKRLFSWDRVVEQLESLYEHVVRNSQLEPSIAAVPTSVRRYKQTAR